MMRHQKADVRLGMKDDERSGIRLCFQHEYGMAWAVFLTGV